ncbi:hypothetical protein M3Y97_00465600 [Aphelenchoides bicaudatus]|nr:hypothetical protein M3Y97_00465600 [Aphelenchoides bicaudatus]
MKSFRQLFTAIKRKESALFCQNDWRLKCGLIWQGRYALYYNNQKSTCSELVVVDLFHGQSRVLPFSTGRLTRFGDTEEDDFTMIKVDYARIFMARCKEDGDLSGSVYLLSLDLSAWKCSVLHSFSIAQSRGMRYIRDLTRLIVDAKSPNKFAVFDEISIYAGRIINNQCRIFPRPVHNDAIAMDCRKIDGVTAYGLLLQENDDFYEREGGWDFCEQDMTPGGNSDGFTTTKFRVKLIPPSFEPRFTGAHYWSDKRLYFFDSTNNSQSSSLRILDETTQECKAINVCVKDKVTQVFVDDQENEIVFSSNGNVGKKNTFCHTVYRLPFKKPDSLLKMTWFAIRRSSAFHGTDYYNRIVNSEMIQKSSLRPFHF